MLETRRGLIKTFDIKSYNAMIFKDGVMVIVVEIKLDELSLNFGFRFVCPLERHGYISSNPIYEQMIGFFGLGRSILNQEPDTLVKSGVFLIYPV